MNVNIDCHLTDTETLYPSMVRGKYVYGRLIIDRCVIHFSTRAQAESVLAELTAYVETHPTDQCPTCGGAGEVRIEGTSHVCGCQRRVSDDV